MTRCKNCGMHHTGDLCPDVKRLEYYPDGTIMKVDFHPTYDKRLEMAVELRVKQVLEQLKRGTDDIQSKA